jgi:nucleotide-binding universal stress UspA family protein
MQESGHDDFEIVVANGEALDELVRLSEARSADLIVVGRHGSMAPGGFGEAGAADHLLRKSRIPFVVVGDNARLPNVTGPLTIVVGVDGTSSNADSVNSIARLAGELGARTIPVLSVNTGVSTTRDHYGSHLLHEDEAAAIAKRLPNSEPVEIINESPVTGLIDAASDWNADLIAIGTRGHRTITDLFAGQISRHLIDQAPTPVLVAPHH